jgi:hypothetical protein
VNKSVLQYSAPRLLVVGVLVIVTIVLVGYSLGGSQRSKKLEGSNRQGMTTPVLNEQFFHESPLGQIIFAYLACVDFDCSEARSNLIKIGQDAVPTLVEILQKGLPSSIAARLPSADQRMVQLKVMSVLGELRSELTIPALVTMLQDSSPLVRAGSADALGQIGGTSALQSLLPLLTDPDELVRERTAIALGKINRVEALPPLTKAAEAEKKPHVRVAMKAAIESIQRKQ